ncbi:MAG: 16S rRNA (uracil(1498)-N(3))-methyltransferase [Acidobacteriota bacterium]|nr:16S rRNA (uracil(1498)-N(3))-methyltransferase [Acidobacteriota bacterium]
MNAPRVYAPDAVEGAELQLAQEESAHLTRVLRLGPGDGVRVFDGQGHEFDGEILAMERAHLRVRTGNPADSAPESPVRITVAPALIKGDGFDEIVRDAVMMGAWAVRPVVSARTVAKPRESMGERWQRVALAATKQSGRAVLPRVETPVTIDQLLASDASATRLVFAEPSADILVTDPLTLAAPASALLLLGPEGGWSPDELQLFMEKAVTFVRVGRRTITAERATLAALAVMLSVWDR